MPIKITACVLVIVWKNRQNLGIDRTFLNLVYRLIIFFKLGFYMCRVVWVIFLILIQSCASNKFVKTKMYEDGVSLVGKSVYVYSMLDIRDSEFGENMLNAFDTQLVDGLYTKGVKAKVLRFTDSVAGMSFTMSNSAELPLESLVTKNKDDENAFEAGYRLLIIPSQMTLQGAWKFYDLSWILVDVKTNKVVWRAVSEGQHLTGMYNDENPDGRATTMLKGLFLQLQHNKLI